MAPRVPNATLVDLLALTLGADKAQAIWNDAVRGLSIPQGDSYSREQAVAVLTALASAPGSTGLAARVARLRLEGEEAEPTLRFGAGGPRTPRAPDAPDAQVPSRPPSSSQRSRALDPATTPVPPAGVAVDLLSFLNPSLGEEKATEAVQQYAKNLRLNASSLSRHDAVLLLESMSTASGLLGVVARFAKVRFLLRYPV